MPPVFLEHPSSLNHDTGGHPEQSARITAIMRELERHGWLGLDRRRSAPAPRSAIEAVHSLAYVDSIERLSARGGGPIDFDTITSAGSYEAALHGAGGAVELVRL